ncbi:hypothetical protein HanIR_Chr17g0871391 [Helianthus annuus]|nr:hypothetical protein HanIR_Chr17g0871391 [Helianthus annuus]
MKKQRLRISGVVLDYMMCFCTYFDLFWFRIFRCIIIWRKTDNRFTNIITCPSLLLIS